MHRATLVRSVADTMTAVLLMLLSTGSRITSAQEMPRPEALCEAAGIPGGLCVMLDCRDAASAAALARGGRFLVHDLEADADALDSTRRQLEQMGLYGLASVDRLAADGKLPYTENLVNVIFLGERTSGAVTLAEIERVLRPQGVLFAEKKRATAAQLASVGLEEVKIAAGDSRWQCARKPRPKQMDQWSHARHAADGNAVSQDALVGPPRRVRWVTGPQQEISNMVTAEGRCFFAGVLARDAFNGLRLWERKLDPSPARGGFGFQTQPASVVPIAAGTRLLMVSDKGLRALDAASGRQLRQYSEAGIPTEILLEGTTILAIDKDAIRAVDLDTGNLLWKQAASDARYAVAGDGAVHFMAGDSRRGEAMRLACVELADGRLRWEKKDFPWLPKVRRLVCRAGLLACEISTLSDDKPGNFLHVLSAADGAPLWSREFIPGTSHKKQARAMFVGDLLWVLEEKRCVGLESRTGEVRKSYPAGSGHCFPPLATMRYLFAGEMDMTNLETGKVDANRITKMACSRDAGLVPANGLLYTFPKHCICWPMLRDYAALAPGRKGGMPRLQDMRFTPEAGPARAPGNAPPEDTSSQWPCYRHDALRSGSTTAQVPRNLKILWTTTLGAWPEGTIAEDWRGNYFIRGPVGPPVVAGGLVYVTRPDAHQVVALDAGSGTIRWTFTANGRVDTAPTIHRGLCLFGCKSGWVYCLRADDGALVWRLRAAPLDERIIAYGQVESPWPVPGSVLVVDDVAYFAAGRQSLADGGILVFAVEPTSGKPRWVQRLDDVPQTNFYGSSGLEFDNFDLLGREGDAVAMSRWLFDRATGKMTCDAKNGFTHQRPAEGGSGVMFPRGCWSYAPRNETEHWKERPYVRPLAVFRDSTLYGCSQDRQTLYRRDFDLDGEERFNAEWCAGWATYSGARKGGDLWQSQRLARDAKWSVVPLDLPKGKQPIAALLLAGNALCVAGAQGQLAVLNSEDGRTLGRLDVPPPAWDGLAAAGGRLFLSTQDGRVLCLGEK